MPSSMACLLVLLVVHTSTAVINPSANLKTVNQWNLISYNFPYGMNTNDPEIYNPMNIVATGVAVAYDRLFVATPKLFSGVTSTISTIRKDLLGDSPVLEAFPDWSFHRPGRQNVSCNDLQLISVYRLKIDSCNRLWALDAGISRSLEDFEKTCPPKILVFDLNTNQVVRRIDFPPEVLRGESLFTNIIIDETTSKPGGTCDDVFIYISDTVEPGIVVYDSVRDMTWRVSHPAMFPDPDFAQSDIQGYKFVLMDGVVGLAFDDQDLIYFQPLATDRLFSVSKQVLRAGPIPLNQLLPVKLVGKKSSQGIGLAVTTSDKSIVFAPMTETAVASYNPYTNEQSILAYDPERLQFIGDMQVSRFNPGELFIVSSRFHRFFLKNLDGNDINTRILKIDLPQYTQPHVGYSPSYNHHYSSLPNFPYFPLNSNSIDRHSNNEVFTSIRQPFPYEPVGLKGPKSPFQALNQGELFPNSQKQSHKQGYNSYHGHNRVRFAKSIPNNQTAIA
ncbi:Y-e family protein [Megaselia abdita]